MQNALVVQIMVRRRLKHDSHIPLTIIDLPKTVFTRRGDGEDQKGKFSTIKDGGSRLHDCINRCILALCRWKIYLL